ncbi:MAG: CoA pyrophosphatase [Flavobacteriales bacterium]|nr:CoA pyrophosphatase [Flavobacteriales bacterium]
MNQVLSNLRKGLQGPLPGHDRFMELGGYRRPDMEAALRREPNPRESAVLVTIYPKLGVLHSMLILRPEYPGVHSGQVAFPGGRREPEDPDLRATALREFDEEIGASMQRMEIIGGLSPVYIPPSRSLVTPFVAVAEGLGTMRPDPREVARVIEFPLHLLGASDVLRHGERYVEVLGRKARVPYFDIQGEMVWGATAMMLAELSELLYGR